VEQGDTKVLLVLVFRITGETNFSPGLAFGLRFAKEQVAGPAAPTAPERAALVSCCTFRGAAEGGTGRRYRPSATRASRQQESPRESFRLVPFFFAFKLPGLTK
jgi:hypothetical protein